MSERQRAAHRAALEHVLALVAAAPVADSLVLRGSMTMAAWVGAQAREPGDLDWVARPPGAAPPKRWWPHPHVHSLDHARAWPEKAPSVMNTDVWEFEDLDTRDLGRPRPTNPNASIGFEMPRRPHEDVLDLVRSRPHATGDLLFAPEWASEVAGWGFAYQGGDVYHDYVDGNGDTCVGARLDLPWRDGELSGALQIDFAYGERIPDAPVLTAIPRADGGAPISTWTASAELSLAWKLQWLEAGQWGAKGKDLYDAVLLAERDGMRLTPEVRDHLMRRVSHDDALRPDAVRRWRIIWPDHLPGAADDWLARLAAVLPQVLEPTP